MILLILIVNLINDLVFHDIVDHNHWSYRSWSCLPAAGATTSRCVAAPSYPHLPLLRHLFHFAFTLNHISFKSYESYVLLCLTIPLHLFHLSGTSFTSVSLLFHPVIFALYSWEAIFYSVFNYSGFSTSTLTPGIGTTMTLWWLTSMTARGCGGRGWAPTPRRRRRRRGSTSRRTWRWSSSLVTSPWITPT